MSAVTLEAEPPVPVWDVLVRVFHWTLVAGFLANMTIVEEGGSSHEIIGYILLAAIAVRSIWGLVGTAHARFKDFIPGPTRLKEYLGSLLRGREPRYVGHNPAAAVMIVALVGVMILVGLSGWMMSLDAFWGEEWVEETHEVLANMLLVLAGVHVLAAVRASFRHRENLIVAMVTGRKRPASGTDVDHTDADRAFDADRR